MMRTTASALVALALALVLAVPALAGGEQDGAVTLTFELTLYGDVPEDAAFGVLNDLEDGEDQVVVFCGQPKGFEPKDDCVGGKGTTYTRSLELERGARIFYLFTKVRPESAADCQGEECGGVQENFYATSLETGVEDYQTIDADTTKAAYYDADAAKGGAGDGPGQPGMPDTGAGGAAGVGGPLGSIAAVLAVALSAAGGYAVRRRAGRRMV